MEFTSGTTRPPIRATTVGTVCAWKACAICGSADASTVPRSRRPWNSSTTVLTTSTNDSDSGLCGACSTTTTGQAVEASAYCWKLPVVSTTR